MDSNDILDDFQQEEEEVKTNWWAVSFSACVFLGITILKCNYLYPIIFSQWRTNIVFFFIAIVLLALVIFLLLLRSQKYLSRDSVQTVKAAYLHVVVSYSIVLSIFNEGKFVILNFFIAIVAFTIIGLPFIVVATMVVNFITDRYVNK